MDKEQSLRKNLNFEIIINLGGQMKATTENIKALLNTDAEEHLRKIVNDNKYPSHVHQELEQEELLELFLEMKSLLEDCITSGELDKISFYMRNNIHAHMNNFNGNVINAYANPANFNACIVALQHVQMFVEQSELPEKGSKHNIYNEKLKELRETSKQYKTLKKSLEGAEDLETKGREAVEELQILLEAIKEKHVASNSTFEKREEEYTSLLAELEITKEKMGSLMGEIESYREDSSSQRDKILEMKEKTIEFFGKIENEQTKLDDLYEKHNDLEIKLSGLTTENQTQKEKIDDLIQHATGASLFHAFDKKRERLNDSLWKWLLGVVFSLLTMAGVGIITAWNLKDGVAADTIFWVRILSLLPMSYLVFFFSNQYSKNKNLLEEYSFKSSLSLSLEPYRELVEKVIGIEDREKMSDFLIESIGKIYESPTNNIFKYLKEDKKVIDLDVLEKILKHIKPSV